MTTETPTPQPAAPPVIAHRGAPRAAPENTRAAIRRAAELGARWVEFDVRLTADGTPVLLHDETLDRTTDGTGPVAEIRDSDLFALDAGSWFAPEFAGERVPTLIEIIVELARYGMGANIEIKPCPGGEAEAGETVARLVSSLWPDDLPPPVLSSFSPTSLSAARATAPALARALITSSAGPEALSLIEDTGASALHCRHDTLDAGRVSILRAGGLVVRAYTVNDACRARELLGFGVQSVISDDPYLLGDTAMQHALGTSAADL